MSIDYANPYAGRKVTNRFNAAGHAAIDYKAAEGDPTPSPVAGVVIEVGSGSNSKFGTLGYDYGKWVVVRDHAGQEHFFAHMSDNTVVSVGQTVVVNQDLGKVGHTGGTKAQPVTGPHTHWAVFQNFPVRSTRLDPVNYIKGMVAGAGSAVPPVARGDKDTVRAISAYLMSQLPGYSSAAVRTGIRGYYYWIMVQRWGKNKGLYFGPVNGIPGVNTRRVEAKLASMV